MLDINLQPSVINQRHNEEGMQKRGPMRTDHTSDRGLNTDSSMRDFGTSEDAPSSSQDSEEERDVINTELQSQKKLVETGETEAEQEGLALMTFDMASPDTMNRANLLLKNMVTQNMDQDNDKAKKSKINANVAWNQLADGSPSHRKALPPQAGQWSADKADLSGLMPSKQGASPVINFGRRKTANVTDLRNEVFNNILGKMGQSNFTSNVLKNSKVNKKSHRHTVSNRLGNISSQLQRQQTVLQERAGINLDQVMKIIKKRNRHDRTSEQIDVVVQWLKTLELFQNLFEEDDSYEQLAKAFGHREVGREQMVFEEGDAGDNYYLVLEGEVDVLKYMQQEIPIGDEPNDFERLLAYYTFTKDQGFKSQERQQMFSTTKERMAQLIQVCSEQTRSAKNTLESQASKKSLKPVKLDSQLREDVFNATEAFERHRKFAWNDHDRPSCKVFRKLLTLSCGQAFGEFALIDKEPRMASVKAIVPTTLAKLGNSDFCTILKRAQQRKMSTQIKFIASVPLFKTLSQIRLQKIFFMLQEQNLVKDQVLYRQNENVDGMYLIKEGEVKYYAKQDHFKPELTNTQSWCRSTLLANNNEQAKKQNFSQKQQEVTSFSTTSLIGNEEIMRKLILDKQKEKHVETQQRAQGGPLSQDQQRIVAEKFLDDSTRVRDFEAKVTSRTAKVYFLPRPEFLTLAKYIQEETLSDYYGDRHEMILSQMKRKQDLQITQFNYQFENGGDMKTSEIVDRFPQSQRYYHEKKEKADEVKRKNSPTYQAQLNKTSLMDKIKTSITTKKRDFVDSNFSPLNVSQGGDQTGRILLDQSTGIFCQSQINVAPDKYIKIQSGSVENISTIKRSKELASQNTDRRDLLESPEPVSPLRNKQLMQAQNSGHITLESEVDRHTEQKKTPQYGIKIAGFAAVNRSFQPSDDQGRIQTSLFQSPQNNAQATKFQHSPRSRSPFNSVMISSATKTSLPSNQVCNARMQKLNAYLGPEETINLTDREIVKLKDPLKIDTNLYEINTANERNRDIGISSTVIFTPLAEGQQQIVNDLATRAGIKKQHNQSMQQPVRNGLGDTSRMISSTRNMTNINSSRTNQSPNKIGCMRMSQTTINSNSRGGSVGRNNQLVNSLVKLQANGGAGESIFKSSMRGSVTSVNVNTHAQNLTKSQYNVTHMLPSDPKSFIRQQPHFIQMRSAQIDHEARKMHHFQTSIQPPLHKQGPLSPSQVVDNDHAGLIQEKRYNNRTGEMFTKAGRFADERGAMDEATNRRLYEVFSEIDPEKIKFDSKGHKARMQKVVKGIAAFQAELDREKHRTNKFMTRPKTKFVKSSIITQQSLPDVTPGSKTKMTTITSLCQFCELPSNPKHILECGQKAFEKQLEKAPPQRFTPQGFVFPRNPDLRASRNYKWKGSDPTSRTQTAAEGKRMASLSTSRSPHTQVIEHVVPHTTTAQVLSQQGKASNKRDKQYGNSTDYTSQPEQKQRSIMASSQGLRLSSQNPYYTQVIQHRIGNPMSVSSNNVSGYKPNNYIGGKQASQTRDSMVIQEQSSRKLFSSGGQSLNMASAIKPQEEFKLDTPSLLVTGNNMRENTRKSMPHVASPNKIATDCNTTLLKECSPTHIATQVTPAQTTIQSDQPENQ